MLRSVFALRLSFVLSFGLAASAVACDGSSSTAGETAGTAGASGTAGTSGASGTGGTGGSSGTGGSMSTCGQVAVPGKAIQGTATYTGTVDPGDAFLVAAVKDGKPGIPAGFNSYKDPVFPLEYEITGLPVDGSQGFTEYGILAYVDHGANNLTGPGPEDPQATPMMLLKVTECEGASLDFEVPAMP